MTSKEAKNWLIGPRIISNSDDENDPANKHWIAYRMAHAALDTVSVIEGAVKECKNHRGNCNGCKLYIGFDQADSNKYYTDCYFSLRPDEWDIPTVIELLEMGGDDPSWNIAYMTRITAMRKDETT